MFVYSSVLELIIVDYKYILFMKVPYMYTKIFNNFGILI